ncbi:MAG: protein TolR [Ferrovum sp. 37-45-19]|uniref:ExbD/TolR family protein n=1 Tax=Ferrovum sp. JA12 TaxID=1356299 RepID=UPI0007039CC3|nr:ExbD/TolR family protein [Ferrovum sp. JA12]OYV80111.1 MAG: protein TolR [Ferrovum sp. 21-44-67]OYV93328.1 MAG: protein TolR [Ferrovum sp. 37-45-19]OZB33535.1 MAG: protein TolR [Ferrovum sp. 34-44-207]HQT82351.1 ExbD/TolR family protein [Ferrovaceae bacterium]KRH77994.1 biopolymer transport protein ExbD [Ferrovum sp. JA12]
MLRKPRRLMNQINVVPYIDVMLVLLIIFMVTAPMISPGQIDLPSVGQSMATPASPIQVNLHLNGDVSIIYDNSGEVNIARGDLATKIVSLQHSNANRPVVIAADKNIRYQEVLKIMDILKQAQVQHIGLLATPKAI